MLLLAQALQLSADDQAEFMAAARPLRQHLRRFIGSETAKVPELFAHRGSEPVVALFVQARQHNLPVQLSTFVGRHEVVTEVGELIGAHRLVTLVGSGGIGKTRVALQVAENLFPTWPDGVKLVELGPVKDVRLVVGAIASALGVQESPKRDLLQAVVGALQVRQLLLILDNCEHVVGEACRAVFAILRACRGVHILATSQEPLKVSGEQAYRVPSLPYPEETVTYAAAARYPAVALFVDRARGSDNTFQLSDENTQDVCEICRRLDGIPLAIELAAARVKTLAPRQLLQRLDDRFRILTGGDRTAPSRQRTMHATLSWSYELLSAPEKLMFERLSTFVGPCTLDMATAVCAGDGIEERGVPELISSLVDKSLVVSEEIHDETRYRLLESARHFARDLLASRGESMVIAGRHAAKYLELAERFEQLRLSVNGSRKLDRVGDFLDAVEREQPDFTAAVAWSLGERGNVALGQHLVSAKIWGSHIAEPLRWVRVALDVSDSLTSRATLALLERRLSEHLEQRHEFDGALAALKRETAIQHEIGDSRLLAASQVNMAMNLLRTGRIDEAQAIAELVNVSASSSNNRRLIALAKDTLGTVLLARGDFVRGRSLNAEALQLFLAERDVLRAAVCEMNLAAQEFGLGDASKALEHAVNAIHVLRVWRHADLAECLSNQAAFLTALDRYDEARESAVESLNVALMTVADAPARAIHAVQRLASVAALHPSEDADDARDDRMDASQLLGYVDARLTTRGAFRWPTDQRDVDRAMVSLIDVLGKDEIADLMSRGTKMDDDEALALAFCLAIDRRVDGPPASHAQNGER
jgi:predicted ATPase